MLAFRLLTDIMMQTYHTLNLNFTQPNLGSLNFKNFHQIKFLIFSAIKKIQQLI